MAVSVTQRTGGGYTVILNGMEMYFSKLWYRGNSTSISLYSDRRYRNLVSIGSFADYTVQGTSGFLSSLEVVNALDDIGVGSKVNQKFDFATADGSQALSITVRLPVGKTLKVNWGDGTSNEYAGSGNSDVAVSKTYSGAGTYPITFEKDYLQLTQLACGSNSLTGDVSGWSALTNLTLIVCLSNAFTGDLSGWSALTNLTALYLHFNAFTGDLSGWSALTNLTFLDARSNSFTGLTINARAITNCNLATNLFSTAAVDAFFLNTANYFQTTAPTANVTYNLAGTTMGIPTGGSSNVDLTRLVGYYTAAGFTCNVLIRTS